MLHSLTEDNYLALDLSKLGSSKLFTSKTVPANKILQSFFSKTKQLIMFLCNRFSQFSSTLLL